MPLKLAERFLLLRNNTVYVQYLRALPPFTLVSGTRRPGAPDISLAPSPAQSSHNAKTIHPYKINLFASAESCTSFTLSPGMLVHS